MPPTPPTTVIAQIEDPEALDEIDAIAATDGHRRAVHRSRRSGRGAGRESSDAPPVRARWNASPPRREGADKPVAVFVGGKAEAAWLRDQGATAFVVASDQGFMRKAAAQALAEIRSLATPRPSKTA